MHPDSWRPSASAHRDPRKGLPPNHHHQDQAGLQALPRQGPHQDPDRQARSHHQNLQEREDDQGSSAHHQGGSFRGTINLYIHFL